MSRVRPYFFGSAKTVIPLNRWTFSWGGSLQTCSCTWLALTTAVPLHLSTLLSRQLFPFANLTSQVASGILSSRNSKLVVTSVLAENASSGDAIAGPRHQNSKLALFAHCCSSGTGPTCHKNPARNASLPLRSEMMSNFNRLLYWPSHQFQDISTRRSPFFNQGRTTPSHCETTYRSSPNPRLSTYTG